MGDLVNLEIMGRLFVKKENLGDLNVYGSYFM